LRARDLGLERTRVDGEHRCALLDEGAVDEVHLVDRAADARTQLDEFARLEPAAELLAVGHRLLHRRRDAHRRGARRAALRVGAVAATTESGQCDECRCA